MKKIGLALGSGGAKGLAHIAMLEVFDELGIKPAHIAGSSIGAIIGVLYCSGARGKELRQQFCEMSISSDDTLLDIVSKKRVFKWFEFIEPQFRGNGLLKCENFLRSLFEKIEINQFEDLAIPLSVVATDYADWQQVVISSGELMPAIQASMAMPGIFEPVRLNGKTLIDGGAVNPVPFDVLPDDCDLVVAIDVLGRDAANHRAVSALPDAIFNTFQIMQKSIVREKQRRMPPDIYVELDMADVRLLEFYKAEEAFKLAEIAKDKFKRELEKRLS